MFLQNSDDDASSIRQILDKSPIGATIVNQTNGKILFCNNTFLKIIAAPKTSNPENLDYSETWADKTIYTTVREKLRQGKNITNLEVERLCFDGSHRWMLINSQSILFEGEEAQLFWQFDITERKKSEKLIEANELRLKQIFEASPVAIGITRESDSTIRYANSKYSSLLGYTHEEILGHKAAQMWARHEDREKFLKLFKEFGFVDQMEAIGLHKDGHEIWVSISWKPFEYEGDPCHLFWIYDISQQKRNETALSAAKEQAEAATRAKSNFLATMSHEIRTPLNGVLGIAQLLNKTHLDHEQQQFVDTILNSGNSLLSIVNDVLDVSKIEAGNIELESVSFSPEEFFQHILWPFNAIAADKGLNFTLTTPAFEDISLQGDTGRVRQILVNLVSNALKFTEKGDVSVTIEEVPANEVNSKLSPNLATTQCYYKFSISDTGTGIATDKLDSIFDPFNQEDNSITRKFGGTGLGLSIVKSLVELLNGQISVASEMGAGSCFTVIIPFTRSKMEEKLPPLVHQSTNVAATKNIKAKILVAEDNPVNAAIITAFLENADHEVCHVTDGEKAVTEAKSRWADVIFMDIHMPNMDGIEATKNIRSLAGGATTPIIALTADAFEHSQQEFMDAGMNDVITKPFTETQILDAVQKYAHLSIRD